MTEIKISEVLELIENYYTREEIAEHYGITMAECRQVFQHPLLKGKRTRPKPTFKLIDDISVDIETEEILSEEEAEVESNQIDLEQAIAEAEAEMFEESGEERDTEESLPENSTTEEVEPPAEEEIVEPIFPTQNEETQEEDNLPSWDN